MKPHLFILILSILQGSSFGLSAETALPAAAGPEDVVHVDLGPAYANFPSNKNIILRNRIRTPGSALPDPEQRDSIFARVIGLAIHIRDMDALEKDLLFVRSQVGEIAKLTAQYPAIPLPVLKNLVAETAKTL